MKKTLWLGLAACAALVGCAKPENAPSNGGEEAVLRIATEGAYAPFNYTNPDGSLDGFDVDIAKALCAKMQRTCQIAAQDWDGIIPALKQGRFDAIVAAMSVTEERAKQVDFSEPYFANSLVFLAKKDANFDPNAPSDIHAAPIAAQRSTLSSQWLQATYPNAKAQLYDTLNNAFLDLAAGRAGAMVADKVPALAWLDGDAAKDFEIKGDEIDINDNIAVAVNKGNRALLDEINAALEAIRQDGQYDRIVEKHFGKMGNADASKNAQSAAAHKK